MSEEYTALEEILAAGDPTAKRQPWRTFSDAFPDGAPRGDSTAAEPLQFAWGSCDDEAYSSLSWLKVCTLTVPENYVLGHLYASIFSGKLYLRLSSTEIDAGDGSNPAAESSGVSAEGGADVVAMDANGVPLPAALRGQIGSMQLVPDGEQEAWLKVDDQWRADVFWEPIISFCTWGCGAATKRVALSVWLVAIDEVLCFYCRSSVMETGAGRYEASYFGAESSGDYSYTLDMPWRDATPWTASEEGDFAAACGAAGMVAAVNDEGLPMMQRAAGEMIPVAIRTMSAVNWPFWWYLPTLEPTGDDVAGRFANMPEAVSAFFRGEITSAGWYQIGSYWWGAGQLGELMYDVGYADVNWENSRTAHVDPLLLPLYGGGYDSEKLALAPRVMEYSTILSAELPWPAFGWGYSRGIYVLLRGASLYGAASSICTVTETPYSTSTGEDPEPQPDPGPPGPDPDPPQPDPEPDPDPDWDPPGPVPGPGPNPNPDPDPDLDPDPEDPETPVVGWWYRGGDGVTLSWAKLSGSVYTWYAATDSFGVTAGNMDMNCYVTATIIGGGHGLGGAVNWGFVSAKSAAEITAKTENQWTASGWAPSSPPPASATDYRTISCAVSGGVKSGSFALSSTIYKKSDDAITAKKTNQYTTRQLNGKRVKFQIVELTLRKVRLQKLVAAHMQSACPIGGHTVSPGSITGTITQSGEDAPTVSIKAGEAKPAFSVSPAAIKAPWRLEWNAIRRAGTQTITCSGGAAWNADSGRYEGKIENAKFTITVPEVTFKNY